MISRLIQLKFGLETLFRRVSIRAPMNASIAFAVAIAMFGPSANAQDAEKKLYVFGNSLINHASETERTAVPYWLGYLAKKNGKNLQLDGQFGFMRNFAKDLPPNPQWGFSNVSSAWGRSHRQFADVGYTHIMFNPANFIQYQGADVPYDGDNPSGETPLSTAIDLFQQVPTQQIVLYEGWAELATFSSRFPPRARPLRKFHAYNVGEYHDWYVDFTAALQDAFPKSNVTLLPVARILSRAFTETGLSELDATDLYLDDAPHGTANLYFLASIPVYAFLYGELPAPDDVPSFIHPMIKTHFNDFLKISEEELTFEAVAESEPTSIPSVAEVKTPIQRVAVKSDAPALGYGLDGISDWSTQVPFVDLMKSARRWVGHLPGQFGGWDDEDLRAGGYLDAQGWPTAIPEELTKIETFILTDFPEDAVQHAAVYRMTWQGEGKIDLAGRSRALRYGDQEIWFQFSPGDGALGFSISETDPAGTGDNIRNVSIVREDQIPLFEAGVPFNPEWLDVVQDVRLVRFMDWMFTNGSVAETWQDRPLVDDYTFAYRGVPMELMVDLVNQIGADPWFNMPHKADDTYMRNFADYVHANLRPGLKAHVEYSNEVWNFLFPQTHWAAAQAEELWDENPEGDAWMQFYGLRSAQMAEIWSEVFALDMARLERVIGVHTGWPGLEQAALKAPLAVETGAKMPATVFDSYAVTGYFGLEYGSEERASDVLDWITQSQEAGQGYQLAFERLAEDVSSVGLKELTIDLWPYHANAAAELGLYMIMYEGGTHVVGHDVWTNNEDLTAFFTAFNYSPEMAAIYDQLLAAWNEVGGTVFNAFVDVAKPSKWGSWGTRRHLGDDNPRLTSLQAYNQAGATWSDTRDAQAFRSGVISQGTSGDDVLIGSDVTDVLLGGDGNDELRSGLGENHLNGGDGNDHAVLPGFLEEYRFTSESAQLIATSKHGKTRLYAIETLSFSEMPDLILSTSDLF